ncbi:hypothetical protein H8356DRAFT_1345921, partial [Neocallimastix lanati (nom. inval.)]
IKSNSASGNRTPAATVKAWNPSHWTNADLVVLNFHFLLFYYIFVVQNFSIVGYHVCLTHRRMSEWLRSVTRNHIGSACAGSSPAAVSHALPIELAGQMKCSHHALTD